MKTRISNLDPKLLLGIGIVSFVLIPVLFHTLLNKLIIGGNDPLNISVFPMYEVPSLKHLLGTDRFGRDVLAVTLLSTGYSLIIGALAGLFSTFIGIVVGFTSGYKGGLADTTLRTVTDALLVIPSLPILMVLSAYVKALNILTMGIILAVFSWPYSSRVIRSQVMSLREAIYVDLAKLNNMKDYEIIFTEILPNLLPFLGVSLAGSIVGAMVAATGLEVLGLGPSGITTLGMMINLAIGWGALSQGKWNLIIPPILVLVLIFLGVQLINMGLEATYNPRVRRG
jgi:peptide/nickel transport system permease protein